MLKTSSRCWVLGSGSDADVRRSRARSRSVCQVHHGDGRANAGLTAAVTALEARPDVFGTLHVVLVHRLRAAQVAAGRLVLAPLGNLRRLEVLVPHAVPEVHLARGSGHHLAGLVGYPPRLLHRRLGASHEHRLQSILALGREHRLLLVLLVVAIVGEGRAVKFDCAFRGLGSGGGGEPLDLGLLRVFGLVQGELKVLVEPCLAAVGQKAFVIAEVLKLDAEMTEIFTLLKVTLLVLVVNPGDGEPVEALRIVPLEDLHIFEQVESLKLDVAKGVGDNVAPDLEAFADGALELGGLEKQPF